MRPPLCSPPLMSNVRNKEMRLLVLIGATAVAALLISEAGAQSRYYNPVNKKTYVTSGEFKTYKPAIPRNTRASA